MEIWFFILGVVFGGVVTVGLLTLAAQANMDEHESEDNWRGQ